MVATAAEVSRLAQAIGWLVTFVFVVAAAALSARRFAAAVRKAGGSLLTDQERRDLFYQRPVRSFGSILGDDFAGLSELLRRQPNTPAERWRRLTWTFILSAILVLVLGRLAIGAPGGAPPPNSLRDFIILGSGGVAAFWLLQLFLGIRRRRSSKWLLVCFVGAIAGGVTAIGLFIALPS